MTAPGRLVVTGASGVVGQRLIRLALAAGWQVTALARNAADVAGLAHPGLRVAAWNAERPDEAWEHLLDADALCHLAAYIPSNHADPAGAEACFRINALGTLHLARLAADAGVGRFVLFSSAQAYSQRTIATEADALYPAAHATYYLGSKIMAELFAHQFSPPLRLTILRLASIYGPTMKSGVLAVFMARAAAGHPLVVHDGGRRRVDLIHVGDAAAAALLAIEHEADGILNIGSGHSVSTLDMARAVLEASCRDVRSIEVRQPGTREPAGFAALDISKARERLGLTPLTLRQGLAAWRAAERAPGPAAAGPSLAHGTPAGDYCGLADRPVVEVTPGAP